jgi:hypothetical protein
MMNSILEIAMRDQALVAVAALDVVEIAKGILDSGVGSSLPETERYALQAAVNRYGKALKGREWAAKGLREQAKS